MSETKQDAVAVLNTLRELHAHGCTVTLSPDHVAELVRAVDAVAPAPSDEVQRLRYALERVMEQLGKTREALDRQRSIRAAMRAESEGR
jgi:hypothetical protein